MEALCVSVFGVAFVLFCMLMCDIPATTGEGAISISEEE